MVEEQTLQEAGASVVKSDAGEMAGQREVMWPVLIAKGALVSWNKTGPRMVPVPSELVILMKRC